MPQPEYHHYDEGGGRIIVLGCETCGCPVLPEYRNEHTVWHAFVDRIAKTQLEQGWLR